MTQAAVTPQQGELILRVIASNAGRAGEEIRLDAGKMSVGRAANADLVLDDKMVSGKHAMIERAEGGFKITDTESTNGIYINQKRITEHLLLPGERMRIGTTIFECVELGPAGQPVATLPPDGEGTVFMELPPPDESATDFATAPGMRIRIKGEGRIQRELSIARRSITFGRAEDCHVTLRNRDVSRQHAKVDITPQGFRVNDLGSSFGTWIDDRRLEKAEVIDEFKVFRLGQSTEVYCELDGREAARADEGATMMPQSLAPAIETKGIQEEGELIEIDNRSFLLDEPNFVWLLVEGGIDIFTVSKSDGKVTGRKSYFLEVRPGQVCFGFDPERTSSAFLAASPGPTTLRKIPLARFKDLVRAPATRETVLSLIDGWIEGLSVALVRDADEEKEPIFRPGEAQKIGKERLSAVKEVCWLPLRSRDVSFDDLYVPEFEGLRSLLPITKESWVTSNNPDEFGGELEVTPVSTADAVGKMGFWEALTDFQQLVCDCEFIGKALKRVDEAQRLWERDQKIGAAMEEAVQGIANVFHAEGKTPKGFDRSVGSEPVLKAAQIVGHFLGMDVQAHPESDEDGTFEDKVSAISRFSGFRVRVVALREDWWTGDHGPLIGQMDESGDPVALIPKGSRAYEVWDPTSGETKKMGPDVAEHLSSFAYTCYRPFPEKALKATEVVRFGARGLLKDFRTLLAMGVVVGMFGTVAPFLTGKIIDGAIPQADSRMLLVFGMALLMSALATAAFKLTQGIATLRIQGRMETGIQSAMWDRLLNLPTTFFRQFSAGDLADRAQGVDQIQTLMSGAGVAAILGAISGSFYFIQMFMYDGKLTFMAVVLTFTFVVVTFGGNYLQLRFQRIELSIRGRLQGLVLNLINGVSKMRVTGTENHAFRVWAERFSEQRRIAFIIGRIQNFVQVFNAIFPTLSSIALFAVMMKSMAAAASGGGGKPLSPGDFIAFNAAYGLFLAAMQALGDASLNMLRIVPIYERLKPIVTTEPEVDTSKAPPGKLTGGINISHATFRYVPDGPDIINDLSLEINAGEFVAFVGGSGSGKSTLLRLMLGFETPRAGAVFFDNQDLSTLDIRLVREQMGVVLQVSRVMPAEIYRNIVGVSTKTIEDAWDAAEKAGLADDIKNMPMGMHTYISEGGGTLSGGQRQRLMIARAIVNRPKILFLDEATSALDNRSQAIVTESMDRMDATRIVIAHRLSTIINADKICYLEKGTVAELGSYQELMAQDGLFAALAKRQMA